MPPDGAVIRKKANLVAVPRLWIERQHAGARAAPVLEQPVWRVARASIRVDGTDGVGRKPGGAGRASS